MRTLDVTKLGIERNFLRQCEEQGLIKPKRIDSEWITHKKYMPREYSQEEIEIVWNAMLCRKMGLSYEQIKGLQNDEEITIRDSLAEMIRKYENQIEELRALVDFMKYVKGIGFVPNPPDSLMGSKNFKDYLVDFMNYLDEDKRVKKIFEVLECISDAENIESVENNKLNELSATMDEITADISDEAKNKYSLTLLEIKKYIGVDAASKEVQEIIYRLFDYQKMINNDEGLTAWGFAAGYVYLLSFDSDFSVALKKLLGEEAVNLLAEALLEFLITEEPQRFKRIENTE